MLEPRRLAARAAAERMASSLGERVGETVGLRVRLQSLVSAKTRIEVVTEGVFARQIVDDPELTGVAAVLFDEFHERSLDADLGLALALDAQAALREDLRLVVMSATLDGARVARLMQGAAEIESAGRAFPVETLYLGRDPAARIEDQVIKATLTALAEERGSILVFLPGQGEITRVAAALAERVGDPRARNRFAGDAFGAALKPIGSGPFKVRGFESNVRMVTVRNDTYWGGTAGRPAGFEHHYVPDGRARLNAVRSGQATVALLDARQIPEAKAAGLTVQVNEKNAFWVMYFNIARAETGQCAAAARDHARDRPGRACRCADIRQQPGDRADLGSVIAVEPEGARQPLSVGCGEGPGAAGPGRVD